MKIHPASIGCDVSKDYLDLFDGSCGSLRIANDEPAIAAWLASLAGREVFVTFEATGRYDGKLRRALLAAGHPFARVNPARARDFARALGLLAKTDALDARMLAALGQALQPRPEAPSATSRLDLAALQARRDQLVATRKQERTRRSQHEPLWADSLERHGAFLDAEIRLLEQQIAQFLARTPELTRLASLALSVPGIGKVNAAVLLALLPELGSLSHKAIAALVGLAPLNNDSGTHRGRRSIRGGRKRVRDALYMAAIAAARSNSRFRDSFNALRERKKPFKLAIVAIARKILVTLNAVFRDNSAFQN